MGVKKSSRLLLERLGIYGTYRQPVSTVSPNDNPIHDTELQRPLPIVNPAQLNGEPSPDRGVTKEPWPHGEVCE
jgi:hypothetical protein